MKNGTFLWSGVALRAAGIAVLALAVMFAACSNPAGGESGTSVTVTSVTVSPSTATVAKSGGQIFTATVTGTGDPAQTVTWSLEGAAKPGTMIDGNGALAVDANEEAGTTLTVTATSTVDNTKSGTATATVSSQTATVSSVTVSPVPSVVAKGGTFTFSATVTGTNGPMQTVTWTVEEPHHTNTAFSGNVLTVASNETAATLTIKATSVLDNTKSDTATVSVVNPGLTITGLGAIYNNGATVGVGVVESKDVTSPADPPGLMQGTVTNGALTLSAGNLNGSYYVGFSSDEFVYFISKEKAAFSGGTAVTAYTDFELYTHSMNLVEMGLSSSMTLNQVIQAMSEGEMDNYTTWKTSVEPMVKGELGSEYVNKNFLPIALYKDADCTQEINGTETVGAVPVMYTKFSLAVLMEGGGESGGDDPPGTAGYINGTVNLIGGSSGQEVFIGARYYGENQIYHVDGLGITSAVESNGSFSIPFTYEFLAALESKAQELHFILYIYDTGSGGGYYKYIEPKTVTNSLSGNTLNVGSLDTVSIASFTLSGTATVTYNGQTVPHVQINAYHNDTSQPLGSITLDSPGPNKAWTLPLPFFASSTDIKLNVYGMDSDWNSLFYKDTVQTLFVSNSSVTASPINLAFITLSGTANVTIGGVKPDNINIFAYTNPGNPTGSQIGVTSILNYDSAPNTWSMDIKEPVPGTTVYFDINWWSDGGGPVGSAQQVGNILYSGGPVAPITLSHSGSSSGPGPGL
jgi:hypothetical protein